jgi:hypothetical protein
MAWDGGCWDGEFDNQIGRKKSGGVDLCGDISRGPADWSILLK